MKRHKDLAIEMGIPKENVMILQSGDVLTISKEQAKVTGHVPAQGILVDGLGVGGVGNIAKSVVTNTLEHCNAKKITDWGRIKGAIRDDLGDYIWKKMKRSPMILPIIMEV